MSIPDLRPILYINGILLCIMGGSMILPATIDYIDHNADWKVFGVSSIGCFFFGGVLYFTNRGKYVGLTIRQVFLFTSASYAFISVTGAMPIYLAVKDLSFAGAVFESVSGLTTTGASAITEIDSRPPGLLLWRALLNGLGGIGIVVMALAILPMLRIGGMQLFKSESSDRTDKILPRATQLAGVISVVFISLVLLCAFFFYLAGMSGFDAICHALATIATGGFSTHAASFGFFNSATIDYIATVFMLLGSLPLMYFYIMWRGDVLSIWKDSQVQVFLGIVAISVAALTWWRIETGGVSFQEAFRHSAFNLVSVISSTGFVSTDFSSWGPFANTLLFMLMAVGGCTGSTAGGIKVFRFQVLYEIAKNQIYRLLQPHGVFILRYGKKVIQEQEASSVMSFFLLFAFCFVAGAVLLTLYGLDFETSMSSSLMALSNIGVGIGPVVGPAGGFATIPDGALWILAFLMILGRVELFTILVLFSPRFWKD